jgi:SAM-dependent methyltransferase
MREIKARLWQWPDGMIWKITEKPTIRSRKKKYEMFISRIKPLPEDKILDVGVAPHTFRGINFLEQWYPYPQNITALTNENPDRFEDFQKKFPNTQLIHGDGKHLDFPDDHFDIVFSNAVLEHVGSNDDQRKFIHEVCRVGRKIFIITPNLWFPVDFHTLIPFAHWFPKRIKSCIYRILGQGFWADERRLNLLSRKKLASLYPHGIKLDFSRLKTFGMTSSIITFVDKS